MTSEDYKASYKQWELLHKQKDLLQLAESACILELRARVQALESGLKDEADCSKTCTLNIVDRLERLEAAENYRQQDEDAERAAEPDSTGSLVERVVDAMDEHVGVNRYAEARAAIREVAAWMRENDTGYNAVRWLEMEADNSRSQEGYDRDL